MPISDKNGPRLEIPGKLQMDAPAVTPEQAIINLDQVVAGWSCDRGTRMALEQSIKVLADMVEDMRQAVEDMRQAKAAAEAVALVAPAPTTPPVPAPAPAPVPPNAS